MEWDCAGIVPAVIASALGEAVGQDWVKKYFSPEKKQSTLEMVTALEAALREVVR